ncbi:MAG: hypothetical protein IKO47_03200 [Ruminococcus sp.]|nr:hypothetical protein [Ruminococcus sp.]
MHKRKKAAAGMVLAYLILSAGIWLFIDSYSSFRRRMTGEDTAPAGLTLNAGSASVSVLSSGAEIDLSPFAPESRLYCAAYILAPDELRAASLVISLCSRF